jgi:GNAT superfamily N-acetyltransferase
VSTETPRPTSWSIRAARPLDLPLLVEIERDAGEMFRSLGMDSVADDDPGSVADLASYAADERAFVAADAGERLLGYILLDVVDAAAHIEQVSVRPRYARQGIGRALIGRAVVWAREHRLRTLTLTTYVDVPWNGPYYERLGFRYISREEESPGLRALRDRERASGLDAWPRACMTLDIASG